MKRNLNAGLTLSGVSAIVFATFALAMPASAGTMTVGVNSLLRSTLSSEQAGTYVATPARYRRGRRQSRRYRRQSRRSFRRNFRQNNRGDGYYRRGRSYGNYGGSCHATSKTGYWYGRRAKIGGTMCYDSYGGSYIVPGSRYLIHYYGY